MRTNFTIGLLCLVLFGCQQPSVTKNNSVRFIGTGTSSKLLTTTPSLLRNIDASALRLNVSLGDTEQTYYGTDFTDGNWAIEVSMASNRQHDLRVQWYANEHLLLEETGSFFSDASNPTISPDMDFLSAGEPRFDTDCDSYSNLEEYRNNTNPDIAQGVIEYACNPNRNIENLSVWPSVTRVHQSYRQRTFDEPITSIEQSIQARSINTSSYVAFGPLNQMEQGPQDTSRNHALIELLHHPVSGRSVRIIVPRTLSATAATNVEDAVCRPYGTDSEGHVCVLPYNWQENHWYSLRFQQQAPGTWQGVVTDLTANKPQLIATVEIDKDFAWFRSQTNLRYIGIIPNEDCIAGVPVSNIHFRAPVLNNVIQWESQQITRGACVDAGAGWSEGVRTIDGELMYSLTLGRD